MGHGGARNGAGRKTKPITEARKQWAGEILSDSDEAKFWRLALANDETFFDALKFLTEQKRGKAPQSLQVAGDEDNPVGVILIGAKHV